MHLTVISFLGIIPLIIQTLNAQKWDLCTKNNKYPCDGIYCESGKERCDERDPRYPCPNLLPALQKVECHRNVKDLCKLDEYWCQERGSCISESEVCDCGPGKILCVTSDNSYFCNDRTGILNNKRFKICGSCKERCEAKDKMDQLRCGNEYINKENITKISCCKGQSWSWIKSSDFCNKSTDTATTTDQSTSTKDIDIVEEYWWIFLLGSIVVLAPIIGLIVVLAPIIALIVYAVTREGAVTGEGRGTTVGELSEQAIEATNYDSKQDTKTTLSEDRGK